MKNNRIGEWIQTYKGIQFYPLDAQPDEILIEDIAHALSHQCRFSGHVKTFYSVAQHCYLAANLASNENKLHALLHDASEAYLVDLPRPIKRMSGFEKYLEAENNLMKIIYTKFGLSTAMPDEVKKIDNRLLITERNYLLSKPKEVWKDECKPYDIIITTETSKVSESIFLEYFYFLTKQTA